MHTGNDFASRLPSAKIDAARPSSLLPYKLHLQRHSVLRLKCVENSVDYTTQELAWLHARVLMALKPSQHVAGMVDAALQAIAVRGFMWMEIRG